MWTTVPSGKRAYTLWSENIGKLDQFLTLIAIVRFSPEKYNNVTNLL